jgi:hypothetical protein
MVIFSTQPYPSMTSNKNPSLDTFNYVPSRYDGGSRKIDAHRRPLRLRRAAGDRDVEIDRWINEGGALSPCEMHPSA